MLLERAKIINNLFREDSKERQTILRPSTVFYKKYLGLQPDWNDMLIEFENDKIIQQQIYDYLNMDTKIDLGNYIYKENVKNIEYKKLKYTAP